MRDQLLLLLFTGKNTFLYPVNRFLNGDRDENDATADVSNLVKWLPSNFDIKSLETKKSGVDLRYLAWI